jgi:hypothetical protein
MGVQFEPTVVAIPVSLVARNHSPANNGHGAAIVNTLKAQADKRKISILLSHKFSGIVREKCLAGMVHGVEVEYRGKTPRPCRRDPRQQA